MAATAESLSFFEPTTSVDLQQFQETQTLALTDALLNGFDDVRDSIDVDAILRGDLNEYLAALALVSAGVASLAATAYRDAGALINPLTPEIVFSDDRLSLMSANLRNELTREISDFSAWLNAVNSAIVNRDLSIRATRQLVESYIGLSANQVEAAERFRVSLAAGDADALRRNLGDARLERQLAAAIRGNRLLNAQRQERLMTAYITRQRRTRAELIARLQVQQAIGESVNDLVTEAVVSGQVEPDAIVQRWRTHPPNVRDSHIGMSGQRRVLGDPFRSGNGNNLRFPGDPSAPFSDIVNCKCSISIERG